MKDKVHTFKIFSVHLYVYVGSVVALTAEHNYIYLPVIIDKLALDRCEP